MSDKSPYSCAIEGCKKESQKRQGILIHIQKAHKDILDQEVNQNSEGIDNATFTKDMPDDVEIHDTSEFDQDDIEDTTEGTTENTASEMTIVKHEVHSNDHNMDTNEDEMEASVESHLETLDLDFLKELNSMKYTDMKITCLGQVVNCHRWILGRDSPVFDKIFSNEDFEKTRVMKIEPKDLKPTIEVLRFIYKGIINCSADSFKGAHMYQVQEMIDKYQDSLNQFLSVDKFFDFCEIEPKSDELKLQLKNFAKENLVEIFGTKQASMIKSLFLEE